MGCVLPDFHRKFDALTNWQCLDALFWSCFTLSGVVDAKVHLTNHIDAATATSRDAQLQTHTNHIPRSSSRTVRSARRRKRGGLYAFDLNLFQH